MLKIYLVRHGESASNVDKSLHKTTADHAIPLSPKGREQARKAGEKLNEYLSHDYLPHKSCRLWTSPYCRTRETADEIQKAADRWIEDRKEHILLCEQQFGLFDGLTNEELAKVYPDEHAFYNKCEEFGGRFWARMPLGESRFDVATRVHQAFGTFHRDHDKYGVRNIIVICHGVTLRAFVMMWCHLTPEWFDAEPNPPNCAIRLIENGKDKGYL